MIRHPDLSDKQLHKLIRHNNVSIAGNARLRIYGSLHCPSGKRMKKSNRVFFESEAAAVRVGFRPCAHCMRKSYRDWKKNGLDKIKSISPI